MTGIVSLICALTSKLLQQRADEICARQQQGTAFPVFKYSVIAALPLLAACSTIGLQSDAGPNETAIAPPAATGDPWFDAGRRAVFERQTRTSPRRRAQNVILFVGDGMDINTVTAARIYDGQSRGETGEENSLYFERFPYTAFSKTYTTDHQISDSAGTASAMTTGVKTRSGVIAVKDNVTRGDCTGALENTVMTIAERAEEAGLSTGVVSTARITHATPAAIYAHSAERGWEWDAGIPESALAAGCRDIARQLVEFDYGDGIDIALGGGRAHFLPAAVSDPEYPERTGRRDDGRNLAEEWRQKSPDHVYVWNRADFDNARADQKVLGLFEPGHMQFEADRPDDGAGEPSLAAMTAKAITALTANQKGYFLLVEGARIDHAHHDGNAFRALKDTQAFSEAVRVAHELTHDDDTLIIVTADHGHTLTMAGYARRGADILGLSIGASEDGEDAPRLAEDKKAYTTLGYINGPGSVFAPGVNLSDGRPAPVREDTTDKNYLQQALVPMSSETHGGQDVPVYASGPNAHLVSGVMEQNVIYHIMADALGFSE